LLKFDTGTLTLSGFLNILFVLGAIVCYIFLAETIGFLIFFFVWLVVLMKWLKVNTLSSIAMAVSVTLVIYLLFAKLLLVPLPWGLWGW
jgi:putative tricarboxylic transport membrane protein